ncbi:hypothetical protein DIPPA_08072 [Diplonema papillatum]|nr:hypothetical protein DIPPA_08072 [Diplonema papillatum]
MNRLKRSKEGNSFFANLITGARSLRAAYCGARLKSMPPCSYTDSMNSAYCCGVGEGPSFGKSLVSVRR